MKEVTLAIQIDENLTVHTDFVQGSEMWFEVRRGKVTASTIGSLITPKTMKLADNDTSRGNIATLAAERITGHVEDDYLSYDMRRGMELEPYARDAYAQHFAPVDEVAFIERTYDNGTVIGFSPDGLVGDDGLIEIKTRLPKIHIAHILKNEVPTANMAQIQTGLFVTGREWADYVSYCPGLHLWTKRVYPDEQWFGMIAIAIDHAEKEISKLMADYATAVEGLPLTERVELLEDMEIKI